MLASIRETGKRFADLPELNAPIKHGRYRGRTPVDVMRKATRQDLEDCFRYILNYSLRYRNRTYKVAEIFATWAINNAPYGSLEIRDRLLAASTDDERGKIYDHYDPDPKLRRELCISLLTYSDECADRAD